MVSSKPKVLRSAIDPDTSTAVHEFMSGLEHPFRREVEAIRQIILGADPTVEEGIKSWQPLNPSFHT